MKRDGTQCGYKSKPNSSFCGVHKNCASALCGCANTVVNGYPVVVETTQTSVKITVTEPKHFKQSPLSDALGKSPYITVHFTYDMGYWELLFFYANYRKPIETGVPDIHNTAEDLKGVASKLICMALNCIKKIDPDVNIDTPIRVMASGSSPVEKQKAIRKSQTMSKREIGELLAHYPDGTDIVDVLVLEGLAKLYQRLGWTDIMERDPEFIYLEGTWGSIMSKCS